MIETENLTKRYGSFTAVAGISFKAAAGEIIGFLGPNGAGKTTTMRMLTGYMPPSEGKATVAGFDVFDQSLEVRQRVGYLPETVPLYPDMTVKGYVQYIAELRGVPQASARTDDVLKRVGMYQRREGLIRNCSKGMRQRIGLAQAIVHDPQVLILDEPTIGLDPLQTLEVREMVRDLRTDHTILFSTHILSEAEQICDRVIILNRGRIIAEDTPSHLRDRLQQGANLFVRVGGALNTPEATIKVLRSLAGVREVVPMMDGYRVVVSGGIDLRARLSDAVHSVGGALLELRPQAMSLEDIFIELTAQQSGDEASLDGAATSAAPSKKERKRRA